jgi:hypothetical protein
MKQIICMKWGDKYGPDYVNKIYGMVARNITPPFRLICLTDDPTGIRKEVICHPIPPLGCEIPKDVPGKWPKQILWSKELAGLQGNALFLDLDIVITGNLDDFFTWGSPQDVILARNWVRPHERLGQSSVFRFPIGRHAYLLDQLRADPEAITRKYQYEQRYITRNIEGGIRFWPRGWVSHFRLGCLGPWPLRYLRPARLPPKARIVIFPGNPDPSDVIVGRWSTKHQSLGRWQHIQQAFSKTRPGKSWFKHIRSYVLPVGWVKDHWRE